MASLAKKLLDKRREKNAQLLQQSVFRSITEGNNKRLNKILGRRSSLQQDDLVGPLLEAVRLGKEQCIKSLLNAGADPNCVDDEGKNPVFLLVEQSGGNPAILKELLKAGSSATKATWTLHQTALHVAARKGYQVSVKDLIKAGSKVNKKDSAGNTPLIYATCSGHVSVIKSLIKHGADPNDRNMTDEGALHFAARGGYDECVVQLLEAGANPNIRDIRGQTPILLACKHDHRKVIETLLDYSSEVNAQDTQTGRTGLHWAIHNEAVSVVTELLDSGADPDIRDKNWQTPFMLALSLAQRETVELLLHARCNVAVTDKNFNTALHIASKDGLSEIVGLLIDAGICVDIKGAGGLTPLMLAAQGGFADVLEILLQYGANPNLMDRNRATALTFAILSEADDYQCKDIVHTLIRYNCDLNQSSNLRNVIHTMHLAVKDQSTLEERLYSALEIAFLRDRSAIFMMLIKAGCDVSNFQCTTVNTVLDIKNLGSDMKNRWFLLRFLQNEKARVKTLRELCRKPVLDSLVAIPGKTLTGKVARLPVSDHIKAQLNYVDLYSTENMFNVTLRDKRKLASAGITSNGNVKTQTPTATDKPKEDIEDKQMTGKPVSIESKRKSMIDSKSPSKEPTDASRGVGFRSSLPRLNRSQARRSHGAKPTEQTKSLPRASSVGPHGSQSPKPSARTRPNSASSASPRQVAKLYSATTPRHSNYSGYSSSPPVSSHTRVTSFISMGSCSLDETSTRPRRHHSSNDEELDRSSDSLNGNPSRQSGDINSNPDEKPVEESQRTSYFLSFGSDYGRSKTLQRSTQHTRGRSTEPANQNRRSLPPGYYTSRHRSLSSEPPMSSQKRARPLKSILRHSTGSGDVCDNMSPRKSGVTKNTETGEDTPTCRSPSSPKVQMSPSTPKKEVKFNLNANSVSTGNRSCDDSALLLSRSSCY